MNKAIFIDKDGTLLRDVPYNVSPDLVQFETGAFQALKKLQDAGYLLIIISNQSGVARGLFSEAQLDDLISFIRKQFDINNILLSGFYYCPHHPDSVTDYYRMDCNCRKPAPGMILTAAFELNIDLGLSWMVGDILHDVEAGNRAGCKTILINNGNETEWVTGAYRTPEFKAADLLTAAGYILNNAN